MNESRDRADVVVIGGGVIGMAVARALAGRRAGRVVLIERASLGREASYGAAGMLAPQAEADSADEFFSLCCRSRDLYPAFADDLQAESGIDIELDTTGTMYVAFSEHDQIEIDHRYDWQSKAGLRVEKIDAEDARLLEPCISAEVRSALRFPDDIQVENRRLLSALAVSIENFGVHLMTGTTVESLRIEHEKIVGVETSQGFVAAANVVIAGGAWTTFIANSSTTIGSLRVEPVRGQMLCFEALPRLTEHVIYSPRGYIVPRRDGRLLAGSTTEHAGFDKRMTGAGVHSILSHALEISPAISGLSLIDSWAGLRPRASDGLPVMGAAGETAGLFFATGHYRNGILLAPLTGELLAGLIMDNVVSPLWRAFSPDRFAGLTVD
ncbi:MAG: glycine oxidase ThiO [Acidobacteriota bacterium]